MGTVNICQPPGVWGRYPDSFKTLWDSTAKFYLTSNVKNYDTLENIFYRGTVIHAASSGSANIFDFKPASSKEYKFQAESKDSLCGYFEESFPIGFHVLTLVPTTSDNIMVSTVLVP